MLLELQLTFSWQTLVSGSLKVLFHIMEFLLLAKGNYRPQFVSGPIPMHHKS